MASRSSKISNGGLPLANPFNAQAASSAPRKPRAHPEPVGQKGCGGGVYS